MPLYNEPSPLETRILTKRFGLPNSASIDTYLAHEGYGLLGCVGGYKIEGRGAQLFERVEGNSFVVQGMPLLPLLGFLRERGVMAS